MALSDKQAAAGSGDFPTLKGKPRPKAGDPPKLDEPLEVLRELLVVERARLLVALRIEQERSIVFPETSVIIRDIERLVFEIERREAEAIAGPTAAGPAPARSAGPTAAGPLAFEPWEGD